MSNPINSGGSPVALSAAIVDATGEVITVAAAATPGVIKSATLFLATADTSGGGLTFDGTTGVVTVAKQHALGKYIVTAEASDLIGTNSSVLDVEIFASQAGVTAAKVGAGARKTELGTASRMGVGAARAVVNLSAVGDTVDARLRVGTNGHAGTFRAFTLSLVKIGEAG